MTKYPRVFTAACLAALLAGAGCQSQQSTPPEPDQAVRTALDGLPAPSGDPTLASMAALHPAPGQVVQAAAPSTTASGCSRPRSTRARWAGACW